MSSNMPHIEYQVIDGLRLPLFYDPDIVRSSMKYFPEKDDIIVSSYPKCGASYVSQIVELLLRNGQQCYSAEEYFSSVPILEMIGTEGIKYNARPLCIKSYLPLDRIKYTKRSKYIYVARHFAECVVSYYKHTKMFPAYFFTDGTFDYFLNLFVKGEVGYGDYISHFSSGYSRRWWDNVLFITYESLTLNLKDVVFQIAGFLGEKYVKSLQTKDGKFLKDVLYLNSSFMKCAVDDFWREMFSEKLLSGRFQIHFPVADKYFEIMNKAKQSGHNLNDEVEEKVLLSDENIHILDKYFEDRVWIEGSSIWNYFSKKEIKC